MPNEVIVSRNDFFTGKYFLKKKIEYQKILLFFFFWIIGEGITLDNYKPPGRNSQGENITMFDSWKVR